MNRFTWVLAFIGLLGSYSLSAQNENNIIKWNAAGLIDLGLSFDYERVLKDNHSILVELHGGLPKGVPKAYTEGFTTNDGTNNDNIPYVMDITKDMNWSVGMIFQYRFYPMRKHAPRGFFLGPYIKAKYRNMMVKGDYRNTVQYAVATIKSNVITIGGGMHFGYQFIIGKHFTFEFGTNIGADYHMIGANLTAEGVTDADGNTATLTENYESWTAKTNQALTAIPIYGKHLTATNADPTVKIGNDQGKLQGVVFVAVHPMLSIGYAF